jgi:hypothetical protein
MSMDVLDRLRIAETTTLDADGKVEMWHTLQDAMAEIKRLRKCMCILAEQGVEVSVRNGNVVVGMRGCKSKQKERWVPFSERRPPIDADVLLWCGDLAAVGCIDKDGDWFGSGLAFVDKPTHWMNLPNPPEMKR